jgi:hypothetical protein
MRAAAERPDGVQAPVIETDEVALAGDQAGAHAGVVGAEIVEIPFGGEALGADGIFGRPHEAGGAREQIGILAGDPESHEPAGGITGDTAVVAVGDGAEGMVELVDQFRQVERKLADGFDGPGIGHNDVVGADIRRDRPAVIGLLGGSLVTVQPINDRIALLRGRIGRREIQPVGASVAHRLAGVGAVFGLGHLGAQRQGACQQGEQQPGGLYH